MPLYLLDILEAVARFFHAGGPVLYLIALVTLLMWCLILERYWYYLLGYRRDKQRAIAAWEARTDHHSWAAHAIRDKLISETCLRIRQNLPIIKTLIALCPLFGLLGTVTGMIDVFSVLAITGGGDARSMAGGVSRATIPTMAGMVAALSGIFANIYVTQKASRESKLIEENLSLEDMLKT